MIQAIITDVDGCLIGKQQGINFPLPHKEVIEKLKIVRKAGIPIICCSAKAGFANSPIIVACELTNPHVVDGGSVIIDVFQNIVIEKHRLPIEAIKTICEIGKQHNFYQEYYTPSAYFIPQGQDQEVMQKRAKILGKDPIIVPSLDNIPLEDIIKIQQLDRNRDILIKSLQNIIPDTSFFISAPHPTLPTHHFAVLTAQGVSKASSAKKILGMLNISGENAVGIGDSENDWEFMSLCKYVGVMGNAQERLKELAQTKGMGNYFIGPSVEDNGILKILEYFTRS